MSSENRVNPIRIFFYSENTISEERRQRLVTLAYEAVSVLQLAPMAAPMAIIVRFSLLFTPVS
jgi:hypothetical protein